MISLGIVHSRRLNTRTTSKCPECSRHYDFQHWYTWTRRAVPRSVALASSSLQNTNLQALHSDTQHPSREILVGWSLTSLFSANTAISDTSLSRQVSMWSAWHHATYHRQSDTFQSAFSQQIRRATYVTTRLRTGTKVAERALSFNSPVQRHGTLSPLN